MPNDPAHGYDLEYNRTKEKYRPIVAAGQAACTATNCLAPTRTIHPNEPWDLGHSDDRTHIAGPQHRRCNRVAGGRNGYHKARANLVAATLAAAQPPPTPNCRPW